MTNILVLLAVVGLVSCDDDKLFKNNVVVNLNQESFASLADKPHFIKFYAPWCGHCQRLAPTWEELAEKFKEQDKVVIGKVDCTQHAELCSEQEIQGYPTLKYFDAGATSSSEKYRGSRELDALTTWVQEKVGNVGAKKEDSENEISGLFQLTSETFDEHIKSGGHFVKFYAPWCGHCKNLAPTWDQLAGKFIDNKQVTIAKVDCTAHEEVCKRFEVRGYPTLLWIKDGEKVEKYGGSRALKDLKDYVDKMSAGEEKKDEEEVAPLLLTEENFDSEVASGVTFVKFFAPWCGHCRNLAPTWADLTRKLPTAKIAKVDCTQHENLCNNNEVQGYPTLVLYKDGKRVEEYNGARELDALKEFVERHQNKKDEL